MDKDKTETSPNKAGFFYRRIGTTLYKVSVFISDTETDTTDTTILCILRMTGIPVVILTDRDGSSFYD